MPTEQHRPEHSVADDRSAADVLLDIRFHTSERVVGANKSDITIFEDLLRTTVAFVPDEPTDQDIVVKIEHQKPR